MRYHYWEYLLNEEGQPVEGAAVNIYTAQSLVEAYVYLQETGGTPTNTVPQLYTDENGLFSFWVADEADSYGYSVEEKFKLVCSLPGVIEDVIIDNVDFMRVEEVDVTDSVSTVNNKVISNSLAYTWNAKAVSETITIDTISWSLSGSDYVYDIVHELTNGSYPIVMVYDSTDKTVTDFTITKVNDTTVKISRSTNEALTVTLII